ncbi:MAG: MG2 domain-containing protein, partial [bacterium]
MPKKLFLLLCAAFLAVSFHARPVKAQEAYFHLESGQIFAPGDKEASFDLYSKLDGAVDIRVYKIGNPAAFFIAQKDWHSPQSPNSPSLKNRKGMSIFDRFAELVRLMSSKYRILFRQLTNSETRRNMVDNLGFKGYKKQAWKSAEFPTLKGYKLVKRWKHNVKPNPDHNGWYTNERIYMPVYKTGAYLIEVAYRDSVAYTVVLITNLRFIDKSIGSKKVIFVCDGKTGKPIKGAKTLLIENSSRKKELSRRTDKRGIASFKIQKDSSYRMMITRGADFILGEQYGGYWEGENTKVYMYTDRPIYRPGHTVHFKGIARAMAGSKYIFKSGEDITLTIHDPDWNKVTEITSKTNENGTINGSFTLGEEPPLGEYNIEASYNGNEYYGSFRVEEYKKPEYKVTVTTDKASYVAGDEIVATFAADYYFGEPVANANLKYKVYKARYYEPWWDDYDYGWYIAAEEGVYTYDYEQIEDGELTLDAKGRGELKISATGELSDNSIFKIVGEVEDESHHAVGGYATVKVARALFDVSIETSSYVYEIGDNANIKIRTESIIKKPVNAKLDIKVTNHICSPTYSGNSAFGRQGNACMDVNVYNRIVNTGKKGRFDFNLKLKNTGYYYVTVSSKDSKGNSITEKRVFYIYDEKPYWWYGGGGSDDIEITLDKKVYMQGDKAKLVISLPVPDATLLFSVEGADLFKYEIRHIKGKIAVIELPIENKYAPNIFLEANAVFNGKFYKGESEIVIPPVDKFLKVSVDAEKKKYHPGDMAKLNITLRDSKGKPVQGEVSVGIVDEAIYALASETTPGIERFFYGKRYNRVETIYSYEFYFYGYSQMKPLTLARKHRDTLTRAALKTKEDVRVRRKFKDTMQWTAVVNTDAEGHASIEAECPDNLTTWRVTARAVDAETRVGQSVSRFLVRKDLILRLVTPRFFRGRDRINLTSIIHNYLDKDADVKVSLEAYGLKIENPGEKSIRVPMKQDKAVTWSAKVISDGNVRLKGVALSEQESDAVELNIPALPHGA